MIAEGAQAPSVSLSLKDGTSLNLASPGKPVLLLFYPKSFSKACTEEMCSMRDEFAAFRAAGVQVVGISRDKPDVQDKFQAAHHLPFPIISDRDGSIGKAFDALWLRGLIPMAQRATFLIGPDGKVLLSYRNEWGPKPHRAAALEAIAKFQAKSVA